MTSSAMSGYRVTPATLQDAAAYVQGQSQQIADELSSLGQYVQSLGECWQGPAQQAFETLMIDYNAYAAMLNDALSGISRGMHGNNLNYVDAEQTALNNLGRIHLPPPNFTS